MKFNEQVTIENHIIKFLEKELGYEFVKPGELAKLREYETEFLITKYLHDAISKINNITDETVINSVIREVKKVDTNQGFLELMRNGVDLVNGATQQTKTYKIVDFAVPSNNHFVVTNQFYFEGDTENIRPDVLIFLNGIPVVDTEAKSATASLSVDYTKGIGQIKRYERVAKRLFIPNCFNIASDGVQTVYGATGASEQYFLKWKDEELNKKYGDEAVEISLQNLLQPKNLLDIIANFIVFEQTKHGLVKKVAYYQQKRATNKIVERVVKKDAKRGLIWHTQGSGKTLTMFFTAWKLRFHPELASPKVFILVDRIDLDDQVYDEFINHGGKNIIRVTSRKHLEEVIASDQRGIFISTTQKFSELGKDTKNLKENIIVLSDEAHRGDEGVAGINLRDSLGNAFFFGFTGTPIDNTTINTHRNYGEEGERYLDYYSIEQAIKDGTTLPVTYEARLSKFAIDDERADGQFDELTTDLNEEQKKELLKRHTRKSELTNLDSRVEAIAQDIVEHFKVYIEPNGFKAQIVCNGKDAVVMYKNFLDKIISPNATAVVFSSGDPNGTPAEQRVFETSKKERDEIIRNFKSPDHALKFLIVTDMLLTGFDAPIEQVMYLDKPLRDHTLLQAIARTNRVYPNKVAGKIIDYYGITRNLYDALDFSEDIVDSALVDIEKMKQRFIEALHQNMELFGDVNIEDPSMENLRKNLRIFIDNEDKQQFFKKKYGQLKSLFEFLSPDPFLKEYVRQFEWLTSFYIAFQKEFFSTSDAHLLAGYGEKVKKIIQENVDYSGITKTFKELRIDDIAAMNKLNEMDDEEKALNLEKMLKQEISENIDVNPAFQKFSERLQKIRKDFEQKQMDLTERIKHYQDLMKEVKDARQVAADMGYSLSEYGLYMVSKEFVDSVDDAVMHEFIKEMAQRIGQILDTNWKESSKYDFFIKEVKRTLQELILKDYRAKLNLETDQFHSYVNRLVDMIIKYF
jgi:type I restriction enzyme, R subunit